MKHSSTNHDYNSFSNPVKVIEHNWSENTIPIVSVLCVTYNHERYIRDALEGFLVQRTTFPFQICILDDASTDDNVKIIKEYANKYPNLFKCFFLEENTWGKPNRMEMAKPFLDACNEGKYIALCDGDDYWTDPMKLQKQVDFLEDHPGYSFCFHQVNTINEIGEVTVKREDIDVVTNYSGESILGVHKPLPSLLAKSESYCLPGELAKAPHGDPVIYTFLASKGDAADLGFVGANYRIHDGGVYNKEQLVQRYLNTIKTRRIMLASNYFRTEMKHWIQRDMIRRKRNYMKKLLFKLDFPGIIKLLKA